MTSSTFLPSYDPALLEPLGSPCMPDASVSSDSDFLFPHNAYEDSLSSCLSASQSPSYSPKCSSIDSDIYADMDQKPYGLPTDGAITMMPTSEESARHSWDSDMTGSYNQHHLGYTYASPEMHHAQPDIMEPRAPMLVVSNENGFWNGSSSHSSSSGGFYQVSNSSSAWSHPSSMEPPVTVHPSTDKLFSNGDSYHLPSPRRISHASASKPRSLKVESSKRKSTSASSPRPSPYGRSKASKNASPERNDVSGTWDCAHCSLPFRDLPSLDKHVKSEHTRPLICVFHWAGCTSRFASKNEWKRHVFSQHLALRYWLCTEGTCGHSRSSTNARRRSSSLPSVGCIFNRKDLYTQHLRRMHVQGDGGKKSTKKSKDSSTEDFIREMQTRAARIRCELPTFMTCPAENCTIEFHGPNAWDDRMEHVAGHLEHAAVGDEPAVSFGGFGDWTLTGWAEQADVEVVKRTANGWRLCNPLKGDSGSGNGNGGGNKRSSICSSKRGVEEIEDAEGEEDYNQWPYPAPATAQ